MQEKRSLREIGIASLSLSILTIFPPFLVMTVVDKVLTHSSYSTLALIAVIVGVAIVYETLLGYARRLIVLVVGTRIDARHQPARVQSPAAPAARLFRAASGRRDDVQDQPDPPRARVHHRQAADRVPRPDDAVRAAAVPVLAERAAGLDRAGLRLRDHHDHPGVPAAAGGAVRPRGAGGDRQAVGAGRDRVRHPHREVAGARAAAQGAVGRADRRSRQMAPGLRQARQLAADAGHADRAVHVDGRDPAGRLLGAVGHQRHRRRRAVRVHDAVAAGRAAAGATGAPDGRVPGRRGGDRRSGLGAEPSAGGRMPRRAACGHASRARSASTT